MSNVKALYDHNGNVARVIHMDDRDAGGWNSTFHIETIEDVEPVIEGNKRLREHQDAKSDMKLVARIPVTMAEEAFRNGHFHDPDYWRRWMNDPSNRDFRVWQGRV